MSISDDMMQFITETRRTH